MNLREYLSSCGEAEREGKKNIKRVNYRHIKKNKSQD